MLFRFYNGIANDITGQDDYCNLLWTMGNLYLCSY